MTKSARDVDLFVVIAIQALMLLAINGSDFSYMFPSQSGLTLGHFFLFCLIYLIAFLVGVSVAIYRNRMSLLGLQIGIPVFIGTLLYIGFLFGK